MKLIKINFNKKLDQTSFTRLYSEIDTPLVENDINNFVLCMFQDEIPDTVFHTRKEALIYDMYIKGKLSNIELDALKMDALKPTKIDYNAPVYGILITHNDINIDILPKEYSYKCLF